MHNDEKKEKLTLKKKILKFLQWSKIAAKFLAVSSTIAGTIAALSSSSIATTAGLAMGAAGATGYAASKGIPSVRGYEKIVHIAPPRVIRAGKDSEKTSIDYSMWSEEKKALKKAYSDWNI